MKTTKDLVDDIFGGKPFWETNLNPVTGWHHEKWNWEDSQQAQRREKARNKFNY